MMKKLIIAASGVAVGIAVLVTASRRLHKTRYQ